MRPQQSASLDDAEHLAAMSISPLLEQARRLKDDVRSADAVLFVTPEYNRDIPGSLKNAIDWASRPWGMNSFEHKPTAVIGASPGKIGTAVAQQNLRSILSFLDAPQMNSPGGVHPAHARPDRRRRLGDRRGGRRLPA